MTAVHQLRFQHRLNLLCKVLRVNRSTYYKHFHSKAIPPRISENQTIKSYILQICSEHDMRLGAYKIQYLLRCDYCVFISIGRVYRLMNSLHLPRLSSRKPPKSKYIQSFRCYVKPYSSGRIFLYEYEQFFHFVIDAYSITFLT